MTGNLLIIILSILLMEN